MAKRQFTSTDTSRWRGKYSTGRSGNKTYTSSHQLDSSDGFYNSPITGNASDTTASVLGLANGVYNLPCKIIQTQGTGAQDDPNWEFNVLISIAANVATFKYPLTRNYNIGAQIVTGNPYRRVVINNGVSLTVPSWDGQKGGEFVQFCSELWDNSLGGNINLLTKGFRGSPGTNRASLSATNSNSGEGYPGNGSTTTSANGNSGGGAQGGDGGSGGGGGGNSTTGQNGGNGQGTPGTGGGTSNNEALTIMTFAGAGAGGKGESNTSPGSGGGNGANSPGNITIVARVIRGGIIYLNGSGGGNGANVGSEGSGGGGASAGGNGLFKGEDVTLPNTVTALSASGGTPGGGASGKGGDSSVGRIRAEYSRKISVNTSPSASTYKDKTLSSLRSKALMLML